MAVAIKNMQMPESCAECPCLRTDQIGTPEASECMAYLITFGRNDTWIYKARPNWCPLIELSDGLYQVQDGKIWKYHGKGEK